MNSVIKGASYVLAHTPDMVFYIMEQLRQQRES